MLHRALFRITAVLLLTTPGLPAAAASGPPSAGTTGSGPAARGQETNPEDRLSPEHRRWLERDVSYIITEQERREFLSLTTHAQREAFIRRFWERRDPIPETLENEYREEHYRRIAHANQEFGRETPREGWMTDRGQIYILLGPPTSIHRNAGASAIAPHEIWHYDVPEDPRLPRGLRLLFYRPQTFGEYRLYSPLFDGLEELLHADSSRLRLGERRVMNEIRYQLDQETWLAAHGVAPGVSSMQSEAILAEVRRPPVERSGGSARPDVTVRVDFPADPARVTWVVGPGPRETRTVHLAIETPPRFLNYRQVDDRFYGRVDVIGNLLDASGQLIDSFRDSGTYRFDETQFRSSAHLPVHYWRSWPLLPGRYRLEAHLRSYTDGRILRANTEIEVPEDEGTVRPHLGAPLLTSRIDADDGAPAGPFVLGGLRVYPRPAGLFDPSEPVAALSWVRGWPATGPARVSVEVEREGEWISLERQHHDLEAGSAWLLAAVRPSELPPGPLRLRLVLEGAGHRVESPAVDLELREGATVPGRLIVESEPQELADEHLFIGRQWLLQGDARRAEQELKAARAHIPRSVEVGIWLARCYLIAGDLDAAESALQPAIEDAPDDPEVLITRGALQASRGRLEEAAAAYRAALEFVPDRVEVLNALADVLIRMGRAEEAMDSFQRSLQIRPDQPEVRSLVERLRRSGSALSDTGPRGAG